MIYLVRHGQTALNSAHALQGRSDHPLNATGLAQAQAVGDWFRRRGIRFDAVWSSPLQRAVDTARLIAGEDADIRTDPRLIEMDYGPYEGMDLTRPRPEVLAFFKDFVHTPAPQGMEPLEAVVTRLGEFLETLRSAGEGKTVLLSTHAIAMKGALEYLTPESRGGYWSRNIGNCAVFQTELRDGVFTVPTELDLL
ncbi:MAG: histidine phosphatase family protein [Oscillospiraceae bacterium]|nr:histidine phosphatase family protein [Oscillospiraceae bacterium]